MTVDVRAVFQLFHAAKHQFYYQADLKAFGKVEYWIGPAEIREQLATQGVVVGDCDDFASLCVMHARAQGLPARFVLCLTEAGESHLVCEIEGWVLDNRQSEVERQDDLDYSWLAVSDYVAGGDWRIVVKEDKHG
ncbi:transglutaminase domain-containing protein [Dechloromonas sp. TW-R-39-2]|uniref:transglutaminase domain-containing protein n=1 Tax=Dechloromonas sp. TW-R-39-2 TaxID=2654218 RepID=UPI00193C9DBB|nr:transglutaminase domain-containing protein [Dechloromonas sp. TW-R-39-2]